MSWSLRPETERALEESSGQSPKILWPCISFNLLADTLHDAYYSTLRLLVQLHTTLQLGKACEDCIATKSVFATRYGN
jgi:hypothetical protein